MAYEPVTLDTFKKKLKDGGYDSITGARRAIGKAASLSDAEKETAHKAANRTFGTTGGKAPAKVASKKTAKKASKK